MRRSLRALSLGLVCASLSLTLHAQTCPGKQWDTLPPAASGWNADKLAELDGLLKTLNTAALVVVHRGKIVYEYGRTASSYNIHSSRKSIMSMLYGIAVSKGQARLSATVGGLGIDDTGGLSEVEKTATMQQLLEARSCVYHEAEYETDGMKAKRPARYSCKPGEQWYYNNWDFNALGTAYKLQTGKTVFEGFTEELAKPLGLENFNPFFDTQFVSGPTSRHPAYTIRLSAHDFARIGLLMGRGGNWCGKQIVPAEWMKESTTTVSTTDRGGSVGYGYLWWTSPNNVQFGNKFNGKVFSARGHLGQYLLVVPDDDVVIAHLTDGDTKSRREVSSGDFGKIVKAAMAAMPNPDAKLARQVSNQSDVSRGLQ